MINQTQQMTYRLSILDAQQQRNSYQLATGKQIDNGSEDSVLYSREVLVDDKIRTYEGLEKQLERTQVQNNAADSSISEIKSILEYVKAELIKANTSTTSDAGLKSIAVNIEGMKQNLLDLANTRIEGEYVFSGSDSSVQPFSEDINGKITYDGNNKLRRVAVEEGSYRERGITGLDLMMYSSSTAYKGETLTFNDTDRVVDQDGNEWQLNSPTNDTLTRYDLDGNVTSDTLSVTSDGLTPAIYSFTAPMTDGVKFEAKTNIFNLFDDIVNNLNMLDNDGNPISSTLARENIGNVQAKITDAFDSVNVMHAELGAKNKVFEVSLESVSSKLTQYNILSINLGSAD
ncbi:MAG: flagellar hook-associated protein 3, partial [Aliarcobacter sp.]|nr:flagellar hook-associated protein 3 [Aliarcobacter sp.]